MSAPVWKRFDTRRPLYVLFWITAILLAGGIATTDPLVGALLVVLSMSLVLLTRQFGLGGIPTYLFTAAVIASLAPAAFLLGRYRTEAADLAIGFVVILVWISAFPLVLRHLDRQYLSEHFSFPDGSVPREPLAELRVRLVTLWLTVMIMLMVGELLVAAFVAFALLHRRPWTALTAAGACLVLPLVTIRFDAVVWDARPVVVLAALVATYQWSRAVTDPLWSAGE